MVVSGRVEIVSPGSLPVGMTEANLGIRSIPRNPLLFGLLHRMKMVEKIGSGIRRIRDLCGQYGAEEPVIEVSDSWVTVTFPRLTVQDSREVGTKSRPSRDQVKVLRNCVSEQPITEIMSLEGRTNRSKFRNQTLKSLIDAGWLEMTIPDKPTSSKQKYRLTDKGRSLLAELEKPEK